MISVDFETEEPFVVGQEVAGVVTWDPRNVTRARSFQIAVRWRTEGRGDRDEGTIARVDIPLPEGPPAAVTKYPFRFAIPPEGPVTYFGRLIRIIWEVEARVDIEWAIDPNTKVSFTVVPRLL
ncbi:MAG: hypothetical protein Q4F67_00130 [Propionibacteriaceae bacterium]|nr:hypothetical protein [Propionibacteriaceae bacterium]